MRLRSARRCMAVVSLVAGVLAGVGVVAPSAAALTAPVAVSAGGLAAGAANGGGGGVWGGCGGGGPVGGCVARAGGGGGGGSAGVADQWDCVVDGPGRWGGVRGR